MSRFPASVAREITDCEIFRADPDAVPIAIPRSRTRQEDMPVR